MDTTFFQKAPFNIDLLKVEDKDLNRLGRVETGEIFGTDNNFSSKGLFSNELFGKVGTEHRNRTFAYIDLGMSVLHPLVYYAVINLKSFYKQIAEGSVTAIFNEKTGEFIKSTASEASTGYNFFFKHVPLLKFEKNESDKRNFLIDLFHKAIRENKYDMRYLLVLPAGMRDYMVDANGKPQEDEINAYYRKALSQASIVDPISAKKAPEVYDNLSIGIQNVVLDLFNYIKSLLEGKHKLILGKWLSRKIFNSTRNVLSNGIEKVDHINHPNRIGYNECYSGIHQFTRAIVPKSTYEIKNKYIKDIFIENSTSAFLTNAKTLKREEVLNSHIQKEYDMWTSADGIDKVIAMLGNLDLRSLPIRVNKGKHYLGLVYRDDNYFKFLQDIDDVPDGYDRSKVTPVTLVEFIYMSIYHLSGKYPGFITRYPITGFGSIYPTFIKLITTMESDTLEELDSEWQPTGNIASSFPRKTSEYYNTTSVHQSHIGALSGDFDGDTVSLTAVLSDEAIAEIKGYLNKKEYYINDNGSFTFSSETDTIGAVLSYLTS